MDNKAMENWINGESYDFSNDFKVLTPLEKRVLLENAKNLLKVQKADKAVLTDTPAYPPLMELEKG